MVWDLRGALLKKEERESARLADFDFRHRVRTFRLLARALGADEDEAVTNVMRNGDEAALAALARRYPAAAVTALHSRSRDEARRQLIEERGNPAPYRLL